jgi:hypothetical protein
MKIIEYFIDEKFLNFFIFVRQKALLNPDLADQNQCGSDPKYCFKPKNDDNQTEKINFI